MKNVSSSVAAVEEVVALGGSVCLTQRSGCTPLFEASLEGREDVVIALLAHGAPVDLGAVKSPESRELTNEDYTNLFQPAPTALRKYAAGASPLQAACQGGHLGVATILLDHGADVERADEDLRVPLFVACRDGHNAIVQLLIERGATVNYVRPTDHASPIDMASQEGHAAVVQTLLDNGANVNSVRKDGTSPLLAAGKSSNIDVYRVLLKHGALVSHVGSNMMSVLVQTVIRGQRDLIDLVLSYEPPDIQVVGALTVSGFSPIHEEVEVLLQTTLDERKRWSPMRAAWVSAVVTGGKP